MKWLSLLCLLMCVTSANAAGSEQRYLEQRYLDLRDRYIEKFSKAPENDETSKQHEAALKELAGVLRGRLGPVAIKGLPADPQSNVDTLFKGDSGFGHLDGLAFYSKADKTEAVVTTMALLKHWLGEHREDGMPQEMGAAFKSDRFYYSAIQDAAFAKYAELPIARPAAASVAVAVLGLRGNGDIKGPPSEIDVVVIQGENVYFVAVRDAVKTAEIPACEQVWKQMMAKPINKKDPRGDMTREDQAMAAFTACFAKAAPNQSWFASAVKKAQSQIELLPLR
ncbi:hypothetical protein Q2941_19900 [Bradyrhizobium sp. UFLA05-153]